MIKDIFALILLLLDVIESFIEMQAYSDIPYSTCIKVFCVGEWSK
ncbi:hypothetical protein VCRA2119O48_230060 [Vibrio crassostreae]|nr:hypothetical protein [Vibrio cyclitrophicus]CAK2447543.1 hypothetical protein VCRA2119O48_230060 [Vibrio crassostreae]CAK2874511.1 hypothetical protein VCRA2120E331_260070 [Vibrio crassostreae]CAK3375403.1 hypothetical protein VCRA2127O345_260070 [Vibrio crassostreae]CAK3381238.1 hypothetical protein VCRA2120E330_250070 [Vibrio crassostreae]CAK3388848.1 hypothetical protein VCRA2122O339_250018 [Vibrio crassostreae]